jgi:hypothetical protein
MQREKGWEGIWNAGDWFIDPDDGTSWTADGIGGFTATEDVDQPGAGGGLGGGGTTTTPTQWSDWANVFGEFSPQQQYSSLMATSGMPYYTPRFQQMAQRQFEPTFGRYLLGGYGANPTAGLGQGTTFADWYGKQQGQTGSALQGTPNIASGYQTALNFAGQTPGTTGWNELAGQNPGMAFAMQDPEAVRAMALSRYYGGGAPAGGYAQRAVAQTLGGLYEQWAQRNIQKGVTSPGSYLTYLDTLNPNRFGAMA